MSFLSDKKTINPINKPLQIKNDSMSYFGWFIKGVVLIISNPKTVIAWMAALSVGLGANDSTTSLILGVIVCIIVGFVTNALYSIMFSFSGVMIWYQNTSRWINGIVSVLFAIAGFELIRSAFSRGSTS